MINVLGEAEFMLEQRGAVVVDLTSGLCCVVSAPFASLRIVNIVVAHAHHTCDSNTGLVHISTCVAASFAFL